MWHTRPQRVCVMRKQLTEVVQRRETSACVYILCGLWVWVCMCACMHACVCGDMHVCVHACADTCHDSLGYENSLGFSIGCWVWFSRCSTVLDTVWFLHSRFNSLCFAPDVGMNLYSLHSCIVCSNRLPAKLLHTVWKRELMNVVCFKSKFMNVLWFRVNLAMFCSSRVNLSMLCSLKMNWWGLTPAQEGMSVMTSSFCCIIYVCSSVCWFHWGTLWRLPSPNWQNVPGMRSIHLWTRECPLCSSCVVHIRMHSFGLWWITDGKFLH